MQKNHSVGIDKTLRRRIVQLSFIGILLLVSTGILANDDKVVKIDAFIKNVVNETEEGYVLTDKGSFLLPNPSTEIEMDPKKFDLLIAYLKRLIGKQTTLYIYDNAVVALFSENDGINYKPTYRKRQKKTYTTPPIEIKTVMKRWEIDSYRLSIITRDGVFCIFNTFAVRDYYDRVYRKLKTCCKVGETLEVSLSIKYHKNEGSYECPGEIDDIEFPKTN